MHFLTNELLEMLQQCANKLLLAHEKTMDPDYMTAFEKTAEACETLYFQINPRTSITFH